MKRYFLFDLDNTLVKTNQANSDSYKEAIQAITGKIVEIKKKRCTRNDLLSIIPNLSASQITEIATAKERFYQKHISETILNKELFKLLKNLKESGNETILLTESRKKRALQICDYHFLTERFSQTYFLDDYGDKNKYQFLKTLKIPLDSIVLFESERLEVQRAIQNGISENQIITIKF